ncbi:unnamed protein product, partial [Rotaria sp. Silwood2]
MFVLGVDLSSRYNSYTYTANNSLFGFTAPPPPPPPPPPPTSRSTISLSTDMASFGSQDSSSYMQAPAAPQRMSTISMETRLHDSPRGDERGHTKNSMRESRSSRDRTLRKISATDFTVYSKQFYDDSVLDSVPENTRSSYKRRYGKEMKLISESRMRDIPMSDISFCDLLLFGVCPLGLGIEDIHGCMHTLIRRNTTIPTKSQLCPLFTNAYAYQKTATIRIFEGEHRLTKYNKFLGEFSLSGLTSNFAAQTLEISICMDIDANGILRVDAEEARSGAKASCTIDPRFTKDEIERHIQNVESDADFAAKSSQNVDAPLLSKLKDIRSTKTMIEELIKLQSQDGSFTLNKDLADVLHINLDTFNGLERYLYEQGFNSL